MTHVQISKSFDIHHSKFDLLSILRRKLRRMNGNLKLSKTP
jgi:hypothetical protein